jgi:hypothetical protein
VGQCGFPDITRIEPLLDSCRLFAEETGMKWLGGVAYGGGAIINGTKLEEYGKQGQKIILGFKQALEDVFRGEKIRSSVQEQIIVKIPGLMLPLLAAYLNSNARKLARQNGVDYKRKAYLE